MKDKRTTERIVARGDYGDTFNERMEQTQSNQPYDIDRLREIYYGDWKKDPGGAFTQNLALVEGSLP